MGKSGQFDTDFIYCSFDPHFSQRSFAAGTAFSKTEVLQAAILETIILGVMVSLLTGLGIILGVIAVIMLAFAKTALTRTEIIASCFSRTSAIGLASGTFLGLATVCYKAAAVSLIGDDLFMRAVYTGGIATTIQVLVMGAWMLVFTRSQFIACFVHWRGFYRGRIIWRNRNNWLVHSIYDANRCIRSCCWSSGITDHACYICFLV